MRPALLYTHHCGDSWFNMACDEWLMASAASTDTVSLRLYTWRVGTITIGYNQRRESACDWTRVGDTPVIRRVTGGRALFHDPSELTYSIALDTAAGHPSHPLNSTVSQTSRLIADALASFVVAAGKPVSYVRVSSPDNARPTYFHSAPCFASRARYELADEHGKIVASAQRRIGSVLLQHGSIKLRGVAGHPALPGVGDDAGGSDRHPISTDEFSRYAALLASAAGASLDLEITPAELDSRDFDGISLCAKRLSENGLVRRDPIKQSTSDASL